MTVSRELYNIVKPGVNRMTRHQAPNYTCSLDRPGRRRFVQMGSAVLSGLTLPSVLPAAAAGPAGNVPMTRPGEMIALHKTKFFHSSTFVELPDGGILHAAGTDFTSSDDGGRTWSAPFQR